ncbi:MAG: type 1 glutamine amidotransferase [Phycisphaerales bacterium]|jgi:GMP synthase-like glutamine amidotransferase|nr:type 1 glutamine amidotransferase [Phycisphaerales bacterium]
MPIIVLQHAAHEGPGRLGPILRDHAHALDIRRLDLPLGPAPMQRGVPTDLDDVDAVISLGGPMNVGDDLPWMQAELNLLKAAHEAQKPVLGICLGAQMIAKALGGEVAPMTDPIGEAGFCPVNQTPPGNTDRILAGIPWTTWQFQVHGQQITKLPDGATLLQTSKACKVQCFSIGLRTYAFQYHFESTKADIDAFCSDRWTQDLLTRLGSSTQAVRQSVGEHYDTYQRLGDRLTENVASFMFPIRSKLKA